MKAIESVTPAERPSRASDRTVEDVIRDLQEPGGAYLKLRIEAASLLSINEHGYQVVTQKNDELLAVVDALIPRTERMQKALLGSLLILNTLSPKCPLDMQPALQMWRTEIETALAGAA